MILLSHHKERKKEMKNTLKKIAALMTVLVLALSLCACSGNSSETGSEEKTEAPAETAAETTGTVGAYEFEIPEGYTAESGENYVLLRKDGTANTTISVAMTVEDDLKIIEDENGNHPETMDEAWEIRKKNITDEDKMEIAGKEGAFHKLPEENGKLYNITAEFYGDGGIYNISMNTDSRDSEGNITEDSPEITEDDIAVFQNFLKSFKA